MCVATTVAFAAAATLSVLGVRKSADVISNHGPDVKTGFGDGRSPGVHAESDIEAP